jgi:hypothetical protein
MTHEEAEQKRKEKFAVLMQVFPGDARLCNAIAMAEGVTEQLPPLNDALRKDVRQFYANAKPGIDTAAGEERLMQTTADVLAWATYLELSLHDLRKALFFRFNVRVKRPDEPVKFDEGTIQGIPGSPKPDPSPPQAPKAATSPSPRKSAATPDEQERIADKLQDLFG